MPKKEIRFGELVNRAGKPEAVTLWSDPKRDRGFMKAVRENRVVTLIQQPFIKKKDFGEIGFHEDPRAAYLIFPKPLHKGEASHVVGIKYELMAEARVLLGAAKPAVRQEAKPRHARRKLKMQGEPRNTRNTRKRETTGPRTRG